MKYLFILVAVFVLLFFLRDLIKLALDLKPKDDKEFIKNIIIIFSVVAGVFLFSYFFGNNEVIGFLLGIGLLIVVGAIFLLSTKIDTVPDDDSAGNDNIKREFTDYM